MEVLKVILMVARVRVPVVGTLAKMHCAPCSWADGGRVDVWS
jgi:hypothetical protein